MRVLFLTVNTAPAKTARGGGGPVVAQHLDALLDGGHDVFVVAVSYPDRAAEFDEWRQRCPGEWKDIEERAWSVEHVVFDPRLPATSRVISAIRRLVGGDGGWSDSAVAIERAVLRSRIGSFGPDVVWAEHLAAAEAALVRHDVPVVYGHHDWIYLLRETPPGPQRDRQQQREERVATAADAVVSGSDVEVESLLALGCDAHLVDFVAPRAIVAEDAVADDRPRLIHLGGMATTASREGLRRFFAVVWPDLSDDLRAGFTVVGDLAGADDALASELSKVHTTGFVDDLTTVLRPYDLHVIPWEKASGTRTRLAVALEHRQVVVATRSSVAGYRALQDGRDCLLVDSLDEMAPVLEMAAEDRELRVRLGRAGQQAVRGGAGGDVGRQVDAILRRAVR